MRICAAEGINSLVDFELADAAHNVRHSRWYANAAQHSFTEAEMASVVAMCRDIISWGARDKMICSTLQFGDWCDILQSKGGSWGKIGTEAGCWLDLRWNLYCCTIHEQKGTTTTT